MGMRLNLGASGKYRLGQNSDINVTPFVDVMLVLLIIFMVALPAATTDIRLNLPKAEAPTGPVSPPIVISVRPSGAIFIDDMATDLVALPADLARKVSKPNPTAERVYVRADRGVRYGVFMGVMNRLQATGFLQVALVNEEL